MDEQIFIMHNFVGENKKVIEIVSNDSAMGCLKAANINNLKVCMPLELSFGNLKELETYDRNSLKELYPEGGYEPFKNVFNFKEELELLKKYASDAEKIRVWSSHLDANEYLLLLYICNLFPNKNISVIFSEEFNWYCKSIGMMSKEEILELLLKEHILGKIEIDDYSKQWDEIVKNNSDLRDLVNGRIINVPINYFDDVIIKHLKKLGEVKLHTLIGDLIGNDVINRGDALYKFLINRLIKNGRIKTKEENGTTIIKTHITHK